MPDKDYLCFTANTAGSTVALTSSGTMTWSFEYSTDGTTWSSYMPNTTGAITLTNVGDKVYFKGLCSALDGGSITYVMTGTIAGSGNIMSLCSGEDFESVIEIPFANQFQAIFQNCTSLITPPKFPATILKEGCYGYSGMSARGAFSWCTSLIQMPELPATTLEYACYAGMFLGCTSLVSVNNLPATIAAGACYRYMFYECTSLEIPPTISLTDLNDEYSCCNHMFQGCTSLKTLPELKPTTLTRLCYSEMFEYCSNIKLSTTQTGNYTVPYRIPTEGVGTVGTYSLDSMFDGTGGTFTGTPEINTTYYLYSTDKNVKLKDGEYQLYPQTKVSNIIDMNTYHDTTKQDSITSSTALTVKTLTGGITFVTTEPTEANTDGLKFAVLTSEPSTKYDGWFYIVTEA